MFFLHISLPDKKFLSLCLLQVIYYNKCILRHSRVCDVHQSASREPIDALVDVSAGQAEQHLLAN